MCWHLPDSMVFFSVNQSEIFLADIEQQDVSELRLGLISALLALSSYLN